MWMNNKYVYILFEQDDNIMGVFKTKLSASKARSMFIKKKKEDYKLSGLSFNQDEYPYIESQLIYE